MFKRPFRVVLAIGVMLSTCVLPGCSDLTATVSGRVLMDGKQLQIADDERGMVVFRPVAGGATCSGLLNSSGAFDVSTGSSSALSAGDYLVSVRVVNLLPAEAGSLAPSGRPVTPAVYADPLTSGLVFAVSSGKNEITIELSSDAGPAVLPQPEEAEGSDSADLTESAEEIDAEPSDDEAQDKTEATGDSADAAEDAGEDPPESEPQQRDTETDKPASEENDV